MAEHKRAFKGVWIPAHVWLDGEISWLEKCLLAEIDSLDHPETGCKASNVYLAKMMGSTKGSIHNMIGKLSKLGYLEVILKKTNRGSERTLHIAVGGHSQVQGGAPTGAGGVHSQVHQDTSIDTSIGKSKKPDHQNVGPGIQETLHHRIQMAFESKHGQFASYPKEGAAIKKIIAAAKRIDKKDPELLIQTLIEKMWKLKTSGSRFYKEIAFTPSKMLSIFDDLVEHVSKKKGNTDMWDKLLKEKAK